MTNLRIIPRSEWRTLPVQPPSGHWYFVVRPFVIGALVAVGPMALTAYAVGGDLSLRWLVYIPGTLLIAQALFIVIIGLLAIRPYRAEIKLGYTTWPAQQRDERD
ncbi:hypothetical protein ABH924_003614 [Arthrobacter sp. GAS37]|uniref:hypothetical protein n=1 Tax=Arthrobacter sp. GAS37 TaxID=3156261 RepID=UPI0038359A5F